MFIFISLKFQYSHESVLHIWTSLFKHLAGGGGGEKKKRKKERKKERLRTAGMYILCIYSSRIYHKVGNENVSFSKLWYGAVVEYVSALHCYELFADLFLL